MDEARPICQVRAKHNESQISDKNFVQVGTLSGEQRPTMISFASSETLLYRPTTISCFLSTPSKQPPPGPNP